MDYTVKVCSLTKGIEAELPSWPLPSLPRQGEFLHVRTKDNIVICGKVLDVQQYVGFLDSEPMGRIIINVKEY